MNSEPKTPMKIGLMRFVLGAPTIIEIDQGEADALTSAMGDVHEMVDVEQKFDLLLMNFIEHEQELVVQSMNEAYRSDHASISIFDGRLSANRRLVNILTASRLYIDQIKHHMKVFFPGEKEKEAALNSWFAEEFEGYLAYRTMEALRNFAQHRSLPLQGITYHSQWLDASGQKVKGNVSFEYLEFGISINLIVSQIQEAGSFKASVLKELLALGNTIDVKPFIRQYVESLGAVHAKFRAELAGRINADKALILKTLERWTSGTGESPIGLAVGRQMPNGSRQLITRVFRDPIDYLELMQRRATTRRNLSKFVITTKAIDDK